MQPALIDNTYSGYQNDFDTPKETVMIRDFTGVQK
jgi:hypothetical protein